MTSQTMDADKLCECFDELGIKAPEQNYYSSYNEYCGELLDELVASTGQLVLKHEDDRGRLEFRINRLEGYLEEQQDEVDRLNKLAEAHKQHIAGLQTALQREKDLVDWYEERYGSDSTEDYGEDSDEDIHYY
ncbi:hypothetical protein IW138_004485 [Coemansia sp. RSA 986]|nr:hypothetical protein IW138_004485 [Coemansia sp. RSA 986]